MSQQHGKDHGEQKAIASRAVRLALGVSLWNPETTWKDMWGWAVLGLERWLTNLSPIL